MVNIFLTFSSFSGWRLRFEDPPPPPPRRTSATDIRANVSLSFFLLLSLSLPLSLYRCVSTAVQTELVNV